MLLEFNRDMDVEILRASFASLSSELLSSESLSSESLSSVSVLLSLSSSDEATRILKLLAFLIICFAVKFFKPSSLHPANKTATKTKRMRNTNKYGKTNPNLKPNTCIVY